MTYFDYCIYFLVVKKVQVWPVGYSMFCICSEWRPAPYCYKQFNWDLKFRLGKAITKFHAGRNFHYSLKRGLTWRKVLLFARKKISASESHFFNIQSAGHANMTRRWNVWLKWGNVRPFNKSWIKLVLIIEDVILYFGILLIKNY